MTEEQSKGALTSMGVWGGLITLLPVLDAAHSWLEASQAFLPGPVKYVTIALGAVLSIVGRVKAEKKITGLF